jgi:tight adherence protein C
MHLTALLKGNNLIYLYLTGFGLGAVSFIRIAMVAWQDAVKLDGEERSTVQRLLNPLAAGLAPQTEIQIRAARLRLARAGFNGEHALRSFMLIRAAAIVAAFLLVLFMWGFGARPLVFAVVSCVGAFAGLRGPDWFIDKQVTERKHRLGRALPVTIDLMVLCLDVGLSIEAAFDKVTTEVRSIEPLMSDEAAVVTKEMGAGLTFPQSLKRMADRVDLEELTTLARLINQASQLGASITQALREYSEAAFTKRMLALEEHAGKISAYLVLPLTICLLPACLLALMGPAIIKIAAVV